MQFVQPETPSKPQPETLQAVMERVMEHQQCPTADRADCGQYGLY